jgi:hypothetical protein
MSFPGLAAARQAPFVLVCLWRHTYWIIKRKRRSVQITPKTLAYRHQHLTLGGEGDAWKPQLDKKAFAMQQIQPIDVCDWLALRPNWGGERSRNDRHYG